MTSCDSCHGSGKVPYICTGGTQPCFQCGGIGFDSRDPAWVVKGKELRRRRIEADRSLREEAKRLGITAIRLSALERGMGDPDEYLRREA